MPQSFVTVAIPFSVGRRQAVDAFLDKLGNPASARVREKLDESALVHFMSITTLPFAAGETTTHIVMEISADGGPAPALDAVAEAMKDDLPLLLEAAGVDPGGIPIGAFLYRRRVGVGQGWFSTPGLNFSGTPGMTVTRIVQEAKLAARAARLLNARKPGASALAILADIRNTLWNDDWAKWAFVPDPAPILEPQPPIGAGIRALAGSIAATFLWPFLILLLLPLLVFLTPGLPWPWWLLPWDFGSALGVMAVILVLELVAAAVVYFRFRAQEETDVPDDRPPPKASVDAAMARENRTQQNHLAAQSRLKPGMLRRLTLRIGLWAAAMAAGYFTRPGFLGSIGVIHFARWVLIPGTDKLLFFSNFDGAWESYLENFIQQAHQGVTGIWSNTQGFPVASNLFFEGATDGDRLRRWTRRQQHPTSFWYSAYPSLTLARIRLNAAIRQGIAVASTESEAADWLSCFGSAPRPADDINVDEIPTLVFGGLRRLPHGGSLLLRLPPGDVPRCREWLRAIAPRLSYGDQSRADTALLAGYTESGLRKLGLTEQQLSSFPVAFQDGMSASWRSRVLGDTGRSDPKQWGWGGTDSAVDAVLLAYAREAGELQPFIEKLVEKARQFGIEVAAEIRLRPLPPKDGGPIREPFGFVDGISQPVLRGAGRWTSPKFRDQLVEPGEIVLGYRDCSGYLPASPLVDASEDRFDHLPGWDPRLGRQRPDFSVPEPTGQRDLGCNGTFLVVRQLEQDVPGFEAFLDAAATTPGLPTGLACPKEWIAAKLVGRWRADGSSLVRHPERPASRPDKPAEPDNAFLFEAEDATGRRCPFGAHIRRANPRDSFASDPKAALAIVNRHRILRVGRGYLLEDGGEKPAGLLFMCLNADIERQFEFVQQTWLLAPSFQGLEDEIDPLLGEKPEDAAFTIPMAGGPLRLKGLKDFITVKGGGYFFLPGRSAVAFLSQPIEP
jgi:deferrochelatase/peroxidase EfeB